MTESALKEMEARELQRLVAERVGESREWVRAEDTEGGDGEERAWGNEFYFVS